MAVFGQRVRQTPHNVQCLYDLDRRVYCVKTYPVLSPQGANIVICGHENGVSIVWRGGRRLKDVRKPDPKPAAATNADSVMIIDSDDDDEDAAKASSATSVANFVDRPVFEDAPADTNAGGFAEVVQTLDLALNQAVLSVAVLPIAPCAANEAEPSILQEKMVFAITCRATADVFVVTLPLTPPSNESKNRPQLRTNLVAGNLGRGAFGDVLIPLGGQNRRGEGVAITLAKQKTAPAPAPSSGAVSRSASAATTPPARVIVAVYAREASGTLRLWDVTVGAKRAASERPIEPFQTEYLPSPLTSVAFNPTHPTQLLAVDPQRAVRIYDYTIPAIPSDDMAEGAYPPQGSWLLSLYPPFARGGLTHTARKPVVAASWIAHGHAILALLADGQWGVWDIDRASSSSGRGGVFGAGSATSGIRGAALANFTISGQIEGTTPLRNPATSARKSTEGDFVPMTPYTRRDALAASFAGGVERLVAIPGGVEVVQQRSLRGTAAGTETAVLWLGGADYTVAVIPDVSRFWDAQLRRSSGGGVNLFSGARPTRMARVHDLGASLQGERCCGAVAVSWPSLPTLPTQRRASGVHGGDEDEHDDDEDNEAATNTNGGQSIEVLVQGETRLVATRESGEDAYAGGLTTRLLAASARRRNVGDTVTSAILVEPRTRKPGTVKFDLDANQLRQQQSLLRGGSNSQRGKLGPSASGAGATPRRAPLTRSLFESPSRSGPAGNNNNGGGDDAADAADDADTALALTPQRIQRSLFDENEVTLTQSMMRPPPRNVKPDLTFAGGLEDAANALDDEETVQDRNVEEEMLDIMEIDRALESMEGRRDGGVRNVFFEGA
ncbi:hypothetical protein HMPREF1624_04054 [Sporothrix schenckii ATCC 58251]|uniref:Nucleoporin NUP37 n=1 Tax=Sporothrix schenckii (strain ATCC 58251 / de Perez 2211183) TaxID=1391915 RepID=U7PVT6_SPOS1|nr:hypothetical protein HMPREF1624_04054 [Sporothrix schenckii ATCC 58251]